MRISDGLHKTYFGLVYWLYWTFRFFYFICLNLCIVKVPLSNASDRVTYSKCQLKWGTAAILPAGHRMKTAVDKTLETHKFKLKKQFSFLYCALE